MQSTCLHLFESLAHLGFGNSVSKPSDCASSSSSTLISPTYNKRRGKFVVTQSQRRNSRDRPKEVVKVKGKKENVWSVDNDMYEAEKANTKLQREKRGKKMVKGSRTRGGKVLVSGSMLMEVEKVLQTQEPVIRPIWNTFASSVSGIWKGVGAVFSPITAEMEPIEIGRKNENLYDCYTLSRIEAVSSPSSGESSHIQRKINWVTLNSYGEQLYGNSPSPTKRAANLKVKNHVLPSFESFDLQGSDIMEEDVMDNESGLVFFEDGSYSRGPVSIPVNELDDSKYYLSPTMKFEQCLVKGCHKRLRIVHTIEFSNGGSDIQILRVAVYEEQWTSPANLHDDSDTQFDLKPFSLRKRTNPSELAGSWKVFEISATPIFNETVLAEENSSNNNTRYVYLCTENLKKRSFPDNPTNFGEEELVDMRDVTILWLTGGVTAYVDVNKDGILCIGVGWYSDEGINEVMERDYGIDGNLREVRRKSEVKRRWADILPS